MEEVEGAKGVEGVALARTDDREDGGEGGKEVGVVGGVVLVVMLRVAQEVVVEAGSVVDAKRGVGAAETFAVGGGRSVGELADSEEDTVRVEDEEGK